MKSFMPQVEMLEWSTEKQQGDEIFISAMPSTGFSSASVPAGRKSLRDNLVMDFFVSIWTILLPAENEKLTSLEPFYRLLRFMIFKKREDFTHVK